MAFEILLFSDLHLTEWKFGSSVDSNGFNSRLTDGLNVIDRIYEEATVRNIRTVVFTGDLFHVRQGVSSQTVHRTFECFRNNAYSHPEVEMYLMLGNHDFTRDMNFSVVNCLESLPRIKVLHECEIVPLFKGDVLAHFLPYTPDSEGFRMSLVNAGQGSVDTHFVHQGFSGLVQDPRNYYIDEVASFKDMGRWFGSRQVEVISGHYHDHALLSRPEDNMFGFFTGAPQQHNFGDVGTKRGFLTYELGSRKPVFHSLEDLTPSFISVTEDTPVSELNISGNFVRCDALPDVMGDLVTHIEVLNPLSVVRKYLTKESVGVLESFESSRSHTDSVRSFLFKKADGLNRQRLMSEYKELT